MRGRPMLPFVVLAALAVSPHVRVAAQDAPGLGGVWTLNRSLSQIPREIGFNAAWLPSPTGGAQSTPSTGGGGRGRRGGGGGGAGRTSTGPFTTTRESYIDAHRVQLLTGEARNPPA